MRYKKKQMKSPAKAVTTNKNVCFKMVRHPTNQSSAVKLNNNNNNNNNKRIIHTLEFFNLL